MEQLRFDGFDVELVADATGPKAGPPVLFLHGSGQMRQSWGKALSDGARRGYRCISLDLRGHGDSDWAPDGRYDFDRFTADLLCVLDRFDRPPAIVGASLGGLVAMMVAGNDAAAMAALVLVDITPRIEMDGAREVQAFMSQSAGEGFASLDEAADAVAAYLPHRDRPKNTRGLERNLRKRGNRWYWHWDPEFMKMGAEAAEQAQGAKRFQQAAERLTLPVLLLRGGRSRIVSDAGAREFLETVPHAEHVDIDGAHHMVAGDANDAFNDAVFSFLDRALKD